MGGSGQFCRRVVRAGAAVADVLQGASYTAVSCIAGVDFLIEYTV